MMQLFRESWVFWFFLHLVFVTAMRYLGNSRSSEVDAGVATSSDQFSMKTVFFNFRRGEADLFLIAFLVIGSFFFFSLGFISDLFNRLF